ncbi:MAG: hypothetical protein ACI4OJ_04670 [Lachnospiraceae bacterium]
MAEEDKKKKTERLLLGIGEIDEDLVDLEQPGAPEEVTQEKSREEKESRRFRAQYFIGFAAAAVILAVVIPVVMSHRHLATKEIAAGTEATIQAADQTAEAETATEETAIAAATEVTGLSDAEAAAGITFAAPTPEEVAALSDSTALKDVVTAEASGSDGTITVTYLDADGNTVMSLSKTTTTTAVGSRAQTESDTVHGWTQGGASYHIEANEDTVTLRDLTRIRDLVEDSEAQ